MRKEGHFGMLLCYLSVSFLTGGVNVDVPRTSSRSAMLTALSSWLLRPGTSDNTFPFILFCFIILSLLFCVIRDIGTFKVCEDETCP